MKMMLSDPLLHDNIKGLLNYHYNEVFHYCKTSNVFKGSNFFTKSTWTLKKTDIEYFFEKTPKRADCIWYLERTGTYPTDRFYIIHEVKTGKYNLQKVYKDHYIGNNSQIWVWAWLNIHLNQKETPRNVRLVPIEIIQPLVIKNLRYITNVLEAGA